MITSTANNAVSRLSALADSVETLMRRISQPVALAGTLGMLAIAGVTVGAAILRRSGLGGIVAMNEIVAMAFAVAVAATLPAATAQGVHLKIDLLGALMGPRLRRWLDFAGSLLLLLFLFILAREVQGHAGRLLAGGRTTPILGWPVGPFMQAVAILLWATAAMQAANAALDLYRALSAPRDETGATHPVVWVLLAAAAVALAVVVGWGLSDFRGLAGIVSGAPSESVGLGLILLWLLLLLLMPVAAVMGLLGLAGTALFLGWNPSLSVLASETAGFLTNPQIAALPLFLLMGAFAMVAGLSDDVYRWPALFLASFPAGWRSRPWAAAQASAPSQARRWPPSPPSDASRCRR
jgi:C4-dicarboxylate transporter, DctM subunit